MWSDSILEFASQHKVTPKQAKHFQCTGEHLVAHQDGGSASQQNIVAACKFCNQQRHRRKTSPSPEQYKKLIHHRMNKGKWNSVRLLH